jgi:hypothetical protein
MATKIVIHVEGGNVQSVYSSEKNVEVEIIDMDNIKGELYDSEEEYAEKVQQAENAIFFAKNLMTEVL